MTAQINGWTVLLLLAALLMGYGFALLNTNMMIPAAAAQIASNQGLVAQVNSAFEKQQKARTTWETQVNTRLDTLEKQK